MDISKDIYTGSCHCKAVTFEVKLVNGLDTARRCDCTYCCMRGAIAVSAKLEDITITSGRDILSMYLFGTLTAKHFFCSICGIYTHHQRRSNPEEYGVNVSCLEGVSPFDFKEVQVLNGKVHPSDGASDRSNISGYLRYDPAR